MKVHGICQANVASIAGCREEIEMSLVSAIALMAHVARQPMLLSFLRPTLRRPSRAVVALVPGLLMALARFYPQRLMAESFEHLQRLQPCAKPRLLGKLL